jgi:hypothetical protein
MIAWDPCKSVEAVSSVVYASGARFAIAASTTDDTDPADLRGYYVFTGEMSVTRR